MTLLYIGLGLFMLISVILSFTTINLLRKNERQEDILLSYLEYLDKISRIIELSDIKLKQLDEKGFFKSDDEIGFFFENVKTIQDLLNDFKVKEVE